jgi:hypothetical protein
VTYCNNAPLDYCTQVCLEELGLMELKSVGLTFSMLNTSITNLSTGKKKLPNTFILLLKDKLIS